MTIDEAARRLRAREVSAVELTRESLRRIHAGQPNLNAFITITDELALEQARRADDELARGVDRGPLHGIPYALKDAFTTRGIRTTLGSKIFADYVPDHDSAVYAKLTAAGAILTGKTGLHELAYGITSNNPHFGAIRNPRDPARTPGGSSGGSGAAVAAEMVFFAMGTDTGGSIRIPAAFCGCVGLKPTRELVSRRGLMPLSFTLDHAGPLARSAFDAELVLRAIAEVPAASSGTTPGTAPGEIRIGIPRNFFNERVSPPVAAAFNRVLHVAESMGARLVALDVPDPGEVNTVSRMILLSEATTLMEPHLGRRGEFGADVLALLDQGRLVAATDYINAMRLRGLYTRRWDAVWSQVDFVFTPTVPIEPPPIGETTVEGEDIRLAATRFCAFVQRAWLSGDLYSCRNERFTGRAPDCGSQRRRHWPASVRGPPRLRTASPENSAPVGHLDFRPEFVDRLYVQIRIFIGNPDIVGRYSTKWNGRNTTKPFKYLLLNRIHTYINGV